MAERPKVALIIEMSGIYGRQILDGIARYLRTHRPWSVFLEQRELRAPTPPWLLRTRWDGIMCRSTDRQLAKILRRRKIPTIDLNDIYNDLGLPRIWSDHRAIGRMGAQHLLERGLQHFAFCGFTNETWADLRCAGFVDAVRAASRSCATYQSPWHGSDVPEWTADQESIRRWVSGLPKPLGLMACNDVRGQQVLNVCRSADLAVPEEVAVVGVDDEKVLCQLCNPPLSSIVPNPERVGYEAAEMLDRWMNGEEVPVGDRLIEPTEVVVRQSSDVLGIDDPEIAAAARYIRENACTGITVTDVIDHLSVSRSFLERRFRKFLGRSPQEEIRSVQIKRAKQLLAETDHTLEVIAKLSGYVHPEYLSVVFKRTTGQTPGEFRRHAKRAD
jgi:LacI family transcriptional regulator